MEIKRIIVSRTDKIGDLLLSIPSFYMVKQMYPKAELVVVVRNYNYEIVKNLPYIDRIIKIDDFTKIELLEKIPMYKADVFVALYNDRYISKLARASKAKIRIGPYSKLSSFFAYNKGVWQRRSQSIKNEAQYNLDLIRKINPNLFDEKYKVNTKIYLGKENILAAETFFREYKIGDKILAINPFMGGSAKNITLNQYANLIKKFAKAHKDISIIILAHISQETEGENLLSKINMSNVHLYANGGDLLNIAAIIDKSTVYLGPSTGPTHIAGALDKRIVGIYPNLLTQSTVRWGVFNNEKVKYLVPDYENPKENYENPYFDNYNLEMENKLIELLEISFRLEEGGKN